MNSDPLINKLVGDLTPRRAMNLRQLGWYGFAAFIAALICILGVMGIRPDYRAALQTGSMLWKPGIFVLSSVSVIFLLATYSLPGRRLKKAALVPMAIAGTFFCFLIGQAAVNGTMAEYQMALSDKRAPYCFVIVSVLGALILAILWRLWLKKSAPEHSGRVGALAGFCAGLIAAAAYAFHCGQDHPFYMLAYYGTPILLLSGIGTYIGKKHLRW